MEKVFALREMRQSRGVVRKKAADNVLYELLRYNEQENRKRIAYEGRKNSMTQDTHNRKRLFDEVEAYLKKHYIPEKTPSLLDRVKDLVQGGRTGRFGTSHATLGIPSDRTLQNILDAVASMVDTTFAEQLLHLMEQSGEKPSAIYTKAGITKQHFSKIKNNTDYKPTKETALAFAVVLHLSLEETEELIGRAGFTLSNSSKRDLIVKCFIERGIYDVDEINYNLDKRGLGTLTNRRNSA